MIRSLTGETSHYPIRQRVMALKRTIPRRQIQRVLRRDRRQARSCPAAPDDLVLWLIVGLGLFAGDCYRQVWRWLVPARCGAVPKRSTLCQARQRLGLRALRHLAQATVHLLGTPQTPGAFYCGMRLMGLDSFRPSVPDSPENRRAFDTRNTRRRSKSRRPRRQARGRGRTRGRRRGKRPKRAAKQAKKKAAARAARRPPPAFPQANVTALCELGTHVLWRWRIKSARWPDCRMAGPLLNQLQADMLLLWDCSFSTYANVAAVQQKAQLLGRLSMAYKPVLLKQLPDGSRLIRLYRTAADRAADRDGLVVRLIEYRFTYCYCNCPCSGVKSKPRRKRRRTRIHRLITTLLDEQAHPAMALVELYHQRWEQELAIDELETHQLRQQPLVSQTPRGVLQELHGLLLSHYVVRTLAFAAATSQAVDPRRISFTAALTILRCRLGEAPASPSGQRRWWDGLVAEVAQELLPERRRRCNPRVLKRTSVDWPRKRPHHYHWPQPPEDLCQSVRILR